MYAHARGYASTFAFLYSICYNSTKVTIMQVLEFPPQPEKPHYRIHPISMSERLRDMKILHDLPAELGFENYITHFHELLEEDNPLTPLLDLSFRSYLNNYDRFTHREPVKYRLGVVAARIVANTQLMDRYHTSIDNPKLSRTNPDVALLRPFALQRFALRSFYESDDHPEEIKAAIRNEVGHIISPEPETHNDWFAVGLGDGHAMISVALGEQLNMQMLPLDPRDL